MGEGCPLFREGSWVPYSTMRPGPTKTYLHTKWHLDPSSSLATIDMPPFGEGELGILTQCCIGPLEAYLHTKWHVDPSSHLATTDIGQKLGGSAPLGEGELGPHLTQCGQG